eukprot:gnl/MRDRNA2_/MRDRNA2_81402_c1_seq1.p1 gnl/MRDRNA2_/MRDRNA2_81402_c1~~gnl/MRDRNA2_/MRDRNA2_81402_c1_seq1.p1  ORF type:complete len:284 (+),score=-12.55 gnl/MRDRNA2_/MRDRNA2_81402_c1_seq1:46-897(+)
MRQKKEFLSGRYHVKYRRRRDGKTDYRARIKMVSQKKNKFNCFKYRLVVRFSNREIRSQIAIATISGDKVICSAHSHELHTYGLEVGLTNYSAAYCIGLLCASRCAHKFGLSLVYPALNSVDNEELSSVRGCPRPFNLILDKGLKIASTGSKIFAALKGAIDGGVKIPHNEKRFIGYDALTKSYDANSTTNYIYGSHIRELMNGLKEDEPTRFRIQFSRYINLQIKPEELSQLYEKVHSCIKKAPRKSQYKNPPVIILRSEKLRYEERKERLRKKLVSSMALC